MIRHISSFDRKILSRVLEIHDEMPLNWDSSHIPSGDAWKDRTLNEMELNFSFHGVWVLQIQEQIRGQLWAALRKERKRVSIQSVWISPDEREKDWLPQLTQEVLIWAKARGGSTLEAQTHVQNHRMRQILTAQNFAPAYTVFEREIS